MLPLVVVLHLLFIGIRCVSIGVSYSSVGTLLANQFVFALPVLWSRYLWINMRSLLECQDCAVSTCGLTCTI
jgi:hypothetical protein